MLVVVSGGMMEVQPASSPCLPIRPFCGEELDEQRTSGQTRCQAALSKATDDQETAQARAALKAAIAELHAISSTCASGVH